MCAKLKYRFGDELLPDGMGQKGGGADAGGLCIKVSAQIDVSWNEEVFQLAKGVRGSGGRTGKVDQKLNSCLTFHSKNWILHLAKKFAVRRISSSSSSGSRRKFFSFTTNLSNFRDLRCTFCSSRSSPRVLGSLSARVGLASSGVAGAAAASARKQNKGPVIFNYGSN